MKRQTREESVAPGILGKVTPLIINQNNQQAYKIKYFSEEKILRFIVCLKSDPFLLLARLIKTLRIVLPKEQSSPYDGYLKKTVIRG